MPFLLSQKKEENENEKIRNERAEACRSPWETRGTVTEVVQGCPWLSQLLERSRGEENSSANNTLLIEFTTTLDSATLSAAAGNDVLSLLERSSHTLFVVFKNKDGLRPSRLTLLWSKLLFLPPLTLYCVKTVYASRETIIDLARDALEASRKFVRDWLLEPLRGVYETIRAGREEAVLVRPESVSADLDVSSSVYLSERTLIFSSPLRG